MNTNEKELNSKIAVWLGMAIFKKTGQIVYPDEYKGIIPDFLHDRNQQKWIIDKLKKEGYAIETYTDLDTTEVTIWNPKESWDMPEDFIENKDEDVAFISAIEQLIDKE